jgi:protocatechuate 3,4-dioxygenase beta subunit
MMRSILLSILISFPALAGVPVDQVVSVCSPYPQIKTPIPIPSEFNKTNNLARSSEGGFYQADGEKIVIYGRLMDANCIPINDAKIYLWQTNQKGYAQYPNASGVKAKWIDPNFSGTGIANSDNLGRFNVITVMPAGAGKSGPYIAFKIEHPILKSFSSVIYLNDQARKTSAAPGARDADGRVIEYFIDITLNQTLPNKQY